MTKEIIQEYLTKVQEVYATGVATEHSYRSSLEWLFDQIETDVSAVNEPSGVRVGRPDFVFQRGVDQITVGHCEAKDIGLDISPRAMRDANKSQHSRYVKGLPNLIYTNCLDFHFYKNGELIREISIADYLMGIQPNSDQFDALWNQLRDFTAERLQTITSAEALAKMMAGKAAIIKDVLFNTLREDEELNSELAGQYKAFQDQLIHDLEAEEFADIYAETIAYGLFGARLHDESLESFTREEALNLLPKSNPFLRKLFEYVAGPSLEDGLRRTVDELAEIFQATDLQKLFENFGSFTQRNDPFIHFYETFLAEYNPAKRKARGVWYTPEPVVNFIVRAVDEVLQTEFGLKDGLADTSKVNVDWDTGQTFKGKPVIEKKELHRVQILDPAAGTGTFLAEVIKQIAPKIQNVAPGQWPQYVEKELIPRLHGFELLMASYAMCHMKLDMMLSEMGYKPTKNPPRFGVYLTNSLEEGDKANQELPFAQWLSNEAKEANTIKRDMPIMCLIGNPPYSGESANKGDWIMGLLETYKKEPGGKQKLQERNPKWINDDYVKFIRMAEYLIEKNGEGVLGFITNHGYLDNPTFRGMRWHLLNTFDKIWVLDLHGNSKKKEISPDGSPDKNVFDIMQGVALIIAVKKQGIKSNEKPLAQLFRGDLWGSRKEKYAALSNSDRRELSKSLLTNVAPEYSFEKRDWKLSKSYNSGFALVELMSEFSVGMMSKRDHIAYAFDRIEMIHRLTNFVELSDDALDKKYGGLKKSRDWSIERARSNIKDFNIEQNTVSSLNFPFDFRTTFHTNRSRGYLAYPVYATAKHLRQNNTALLFDRMTKDEISAFVSDKVMTHKSVARYDGTYFAPLYLYPDEHDLDQAIRVNMTPKIRKKIEEAVTETASIGEATSLLSDTDEPNITPRYDTDGRPNEVAIFDYIYGVLHCPMYRETYKEFLKVDFPRIPYPSSPERFRDLQDKGTQLRRLHLMEDEVIGETPYPFEGDGDAIVGKPKLENGCVFINDTQSFTNVPEIAWNFYIGGYQPAQKWLKDRKGRELNFDDIRHYQKIIKILSETDRIMKTIKMDL